MFRCLPRTVFFIFLLLMFSQSVFGQICGGPPYPPCPTPTPAPSPAPAPTAPPTAPPPPSPSPVPAPAPPSPPTTTSVSNIPGYTSTGNYGVGRTVAYIIAPFAVVAGTYFIGHQHQIEIHPNAGFFWPRQTDITHMRDEGIYGLKASAGLTHNIQVEGNFAYINHFESRFAPTKLDQSFGIPARTIHGLLYDVNGVFEFGKHQILGNGVKPYVTAGLGGLSTEVGQDAAAVAGGQFYTRNAIGAVVLDTGRKVIVADNTPFFTVNYGGGIKADRLWGPMGVRVDVRGRTFPNFRGETLTWPEASAGLTFTFGER